MDLLVVKWLLPIFICMVPQKLQSSITQNIMSPVSKHILVISPNNHKLAFPSHLIVICEFKKYAGYVKNRMELKFSVFSFSWIKFSVFFLKVSSPEGSVSRNGCTLSAHLCCQCCHLIPRRASVDLGRKCNTSGNSAQNMQASVSF